MVEKSLKPQEQERDNEEAFNALLGKMMSTPPKPHDQMKKGREPRPDKDD